jgi:hypothetical protein
VLVNGVGFSAVVGQNQVTIGGLPAGVNAASATQLEVVIPGGLAVDQHVPVVVNNLDDATSFTWYWWSKDTVANTAAMVLRTKIPGFDERARGLGRYVANNATAEARYFERIATKILLVTDMLSAKGNFWSRAAAELGVRQALAGTLGQPFVSAVSAVGGQFQDRRCSTLHWGCSLDVAITSLLAVANGMDSQQPAVAGSTTKQVVPFTGQIVLMSMRERFSASSRVNSIEVLVNDVSVLLLQNGDPDFPGPGIRNGQSLTFYPGLAVTQGDSVQVRVTRNNTTTDCAVLATALVV